MRHRQGGGGVSPSTNSSNTNQQQKRPITPYIPPVRVKSPDAAAIAAAEKRNRFKNLVEKGRGIKRHTAAQMEEKVLVPAENRRLLRLTQAMSVEERRARGDSNLSEFSLSNSNANMSSDNSVASLEKLFHNRAEAAVAKSIGGAGKNVSGDGLQWDQIDSMLLTRNNTALSLNGLVAGGGAHDVGMGDEELDLGRTGGTATTMMSFSAGWSVHEESQVVRNKSKNKHSDSSPFTDADTHVSNKPLLAVFPLADKQLFPVRKPNRGSWQLGLREYNSDGSKVLDPILDAEHRSIRSRRKSAFEVHNAELLAAQQALRDKEEAEAAAIRAVVEAENARRRQELMDAHPGRFLKSDSEDEFQQVVEMAMKKTVEEKPNNYLSKFKKAGRTIIDTQRVVAPVEQDITKEDGVAKHYALPVLPHVSAEDQQRYFGEPAKELFYTTYKQLVTQGKLLQGGYTELKEVIKDPCPTNVLTSSTIALQSSGVLPSASSDGGQKEQEQNPLLSVRIPAGLGSAPLSTVHSALNSPMNFQGGSSGVDTTHSSSNNVNTNNNYNTHTGSLVVGEDSVAFAESSLLWGGGDGGGREGGDGYRSSLVPVGNTVPATEATASLPFIATGGAAAKFDDRNNVAKSNSILVATTSAACTETRQEMLLRRRAEGASRESLHMLDIPLEDDHAFESTYNAASPRALFLAGCLQLGVPPITMAVLRKKVAPVLSIPHMGIGDKVAGILAPCICRLPYLQTVNLNDNNLEDDGLYDLITAISEHEDVRILDIGKNTIGPRAAGALANFVGNSECKLLCLKMSEADIDDGECAAFVEVLMRNRHLQELDMSKNLLGKDENLNVVQPDCITGGESLAELINEGSCPLQILNLHWNMIRLEGAVVLCDSLRNSRTLQNVDLSYNSLGRIAADVLGSALIDNTSLKVLNVAHNGIDSIGCFTLLVGARENKKLTFLCLDGNPVGEQGGRMLMRLAVSDGHRLTISAKNCDFLIKQAEKLFDCGNPYGSYELDLSVPYQRAIMGEIVHMAASDPSLSLSSIGYQQQASASSTAFEPMLLERVQISKHAEQLTMNEKQEKHYQECMATLAELKNERILHAALQYEETDDIQYRNTFKIDSLKHILHLLDIRLPREMLHDVVKGIDPYETNHVDINEFVQYLVTRGRVANKRLRALMHDFVLKVSGERPRSGKHEREAYFPPNFGKIKLKLVDGFLAPQTTIPLSRTQCNHVIKAATACTLPLPLLHYAVQSSKMYYEEARMLYTEIMKRSEDSVDAIAKLLNRMTDTNDATYLLKCVLGNDVIQMKRLKQQLGKTFYLLIGVYTGFHSLDLSLTQDRQALQLLLAHSAKCNIARKYGTSGSAADAAAIATSAPVTVRSRPGTAKGGRSSRPGSSRGGGGGVGVPVVSEVEVGDTSQNGNWSCFRNERFFKGIEYAGSPELPSDFYICPRYFYPVPLKGKLEFDFVSTMRPDVEVCRATKDDRVLDALILSRLLPEEKIELVLKQQDKLNIKCTRNIISTGSGRSLHKTDTARAYTLGEQMHNMYLLINPPIFVPLGGEVAPPLENERKKSLEKSAKRELLKSQALTEVKDKGGKKDIGGGKKGAGGAGNKKGGGGGVAMGLASASSDSQDTAGGGKMSLSTQMKRMEENKAKAGLKKPPLTEKQKQEIIRFKSLVAQRLNVPSKAAWKKRMFDVVVEGDGSDEFKCTWLLEFFESELMNSWLRCAHLALILQYFRSGRAFKSCVGTYRVELVVLFFQRIVDLHNFALILSVLSAEEQAAVYVRLGVLNVFNPCQAEGCYMLDLSRWEERQLCKILLHITTAELPTWGHGCTTAQELANINKLNRSFITEWGAIPPAPGSWDVPNSWLNTTDGIPKKGIFTMEVYAGEGMRLNGCGVHYTLRHMLCCLVLMDLRNISFEIRSGTYFLENRGNAITTESAPASMPGAAGDNRRRLSNFTKTIASTEGLRLACQQHTLAYLGTDISIGSANGSVAHALDELSCNLSLGPDDSVVTDVQHAASINEEDSVDTEKQRKILSRAVKAAVKPDFNVHGAMPKAVRYSVHHANSHLEEHTPIKWKYSNTVPGDDSWQVPRIV